MKKFLMVFACCALLCGSGYRIYLFFTPSEEPLTESVKNKPLRSLDVDAMAARLNKNQESYQKLRDESLAVYAQLHPVPSSRDLRAKTAIRLAAYLWVWDDFYGEGLWKTFADYANSILPAQGGKPEVCDPLLVLVADVEYFRFVHSTKDSNVESMAKDVASLDATSYPEAFKVWGHRLMLQNLIRVKKDSKFGPSMTKSIELLPGVMEKLKIKYQALAKEGWPEELLYKAGDGCLDLAENDADNLPRLAKSLDEALESEMPESFVRPALQGSFYVTYAWNARGKGWASSVTEEGWVLMKERLIKAGEILEKAYEKYPNEGTIPRTMISVGLGLQTGKEDLNMWFQRAIKCDPNNYFYYKAKLYYLLPRWYGSNEEILGFGLECEGTQNWQAKIPMILLLAFEDMAENNPKTFATPKIWEATEKLLQTYLEHYPQSTTYRSKYAKYAVLSGHPQAAKKQFEILGEDWDREVFSQKEYKSMKTEADRS
jgi:hypothetical protein